jgi:hypothetical protein
MEMLRLYETVSAVGLTVPRSSESVKYSYSDRSFRSIQDRWAREDPRPNEGPQLLQNSADINPACRQQVAERISQICEHCQEPHFQGNS